jgi:multidrug efflux pump subunit AcrA (membrane-fusion protein)
LRVDAIRARAENEAEILHPDPPPLVARALAVLLLLTLAGAAAAAFLLELPLTVRCRFVLVPEQGADPVQAPRRGILVRRLVEEGSEVEASTLLCEIRSEEARALAMERDALRSRIPLLRERLAAVQAKAEAQEE